MHSPRALSVAALVIGSLALAGCVVAPPAVPDADTTPTTSQPAPSDASPAPSASSEPTESQAPSTDGSTVTLDGQPVGSWGSTLTCLAYEDGALVSSDSADESGSFVGSAEQAGGSWQVTGVLFTDGDDVYFQSDETAPATFEGGVLSAELSVDGFTGASQTLAFSVSC